MDNLPLDLLDLNNGLNNDNNGDDDSSGGSSMILDLLRCQNEPISIALEVPEEEGDLMTHWLSLNQCLTKRQPYQRFQQQLI